MLQYLQTVPDRRCNAIDRENPGASTCSVLQDPKGEVVSTSNVSCKDFACVSFIVIVLENPYIVLENPQ